MNSILLNKHLLHRAGFGVDLKDISRIKTVLPKIWKRIIKEIRKYSPIKINLEDFSAYKPKISQCRNEKIFPEEE